ncbi:MAG: hypothetical protein IKM48_04385 [Clostridia bacterium]|nr:hypothetical protein [Clostridia bacterium]
MKKIRITAWLLTLLMLISVCNPIARAVPIEDPMDVDLSGVPSVWFEEHPEWQEVYRRSWEIHKEKIEKIGTGCNPEGSYYVDEAFNSNIFLWDTSFMMLFDKYGYFEFPTLESLNNFYYNQHDEEGEEYGFICRVLSQSTGEDVWPNEVVNGDNRALASINPPLLSWAEWEQYKIHGDATRFTQEIDGKTVFERLCNFYDYIENSRRKENGLYGGTNGYGSGLDNTPNQDNEKLTWGEADGSQTQNDLSIQQAQNAYYIAMIAAEIGENEKAAYYQAKYEELSRLINELLWDETTAIYSNLTADGVKTNISTPTSLWALLAGVATEETAQAMIENHALNSEKLYRPGGLASLEYDWDGSTTSYIPEGGYWRGGIWAPTSYAYIKGLENYGRHELAFQEAVRHLNLVTEAYDYEGTLYENYSSEYDIEDTVGGSRRKDFVGWTGCLSIGVILENIIGVHPDAAAKTVDWYPALTESYGVEKLRFGKNQLSLSVAARETAESPLSFTVEAKKPFTLRVHLNGKTYEQAVSVGKASYTVGEAFEGKGGYLGVKIRPLNEVENTLPADALDAVTVTETLNEAVTDGIQYRTEGKGLLYNINSVGYYWGGSAKYFQNPVTVENGRWVKSSVTDGDEGFMAMAPANGALKTLRLVVGVSGGVAELKAALSDASDAAVDLRLEEGEYVVDLPYRADGAGRSLLAQWVLDNDTVKSSAQVTLQAVALLEGGELLPGIPTDVKVECSEGKLKVTASPAFGERYDSYAIYYGSERMVANTLPALFEVEPYKTYTVAVAGIREGLESQKAIAEPVFAEPKGINDYVRALEDIDQTLPYILGQNTETKTVGWYQPASVGVAFGSAMTFRAESNVEGYGVQDDGSVFFPPQGSAPVQSKITLTATLNGVTAERVLYTTVLPASLEENKGVFVGAENATSSSMMAVDLTKVGSIDWVQLTDSTNFKLSDMVQKKDASVITDIYWSEGSRKEKVTDNYYTYTATDGTGSTVDRFALSTRNVGTSINVKLNGSEAARRIRVYAGGWKSDYRVDLLVNGQMYSSANGSTGTTQLSTAFTFDYQGAATDEVVVRVVLTDPTAWGNSSGSAYISAIAVGETEDKSAAFAGSENATSASMMKVDLTDVGGLDWVQLTDGTNFNLSDMAQKKDSSVITDIYWADGGRKQTVTDNYYTYTATDGTGSTKDRYALSTRNVGSSINVKMNGGTEARKIRLYAGGWKSDYRVDLLVNGVVEATANGSTGTAQLSTLFTFDYQGAAADELILRVVLTNPTAWGATNGSAYIAAVAVDLVGHEYGPWETVTAAGIGTAGLRRRVCVEAGCNATEEQALPALLGNRSAELQAVIDRIGTMDTKWFEDADVEALKVKAAEVQGEMAEMDGDALYAAEKELLVAAGSLTYKTYPAVTAQGTLPVEPLYYLISSTEEYKYWVNAVNSGSWRGNVALGADLDLSDVTASVNGFSGIFDGQGKTLSNLKVAMFSRFAGTLKDLICTDFARTGTATKQAALIDATFGATTIENLTMKNSTLTNGYGISALLVGQPGGALTFLDITLEKCTASFISSFGGKGLLLGGGADNNVWHPIVMDRILLEGCTLNSAEQAQNYQRTGMLAGEATANGGTAIRNVLMIDCNGSAPIGTDTVYYDAALIACRLGGGDTVSGCLILGGSFEGIENVTSANSNNHGIISRCFWNGDAEVPDLTKVSAAELESGEIAYLLSQISGQWTVRDGETVLKTSAEEETHLISFTWEETTIPCYTDTSGKLITLPQESDITWISEEALDTRSFTENTEIFGVLLGDCNGNGIRDTADAIMLLRVIDGGMELPLYLTDINRDGKLRIFDAIRFLQLMNA